MLTVSRAELDPTHVYILHAQNTKSHCIRKVCNSLRVTGEEIITEYQSADRVSSMWGPVMETTTVEYITV